MAIIAHKLPQTESLVHFLKPIEWADPSVAAVFARRANKGAFFTLAHEGCSLERLLRFREGGVAPMGPPVQSGGYTLRPVYTLKGELAEVVVQEVRRAPKPCLLLHEPYLSEGDKSELVTEMTRLGSSLWKIVFPIGLNAIELSQQIARFQVSWHALVVLSFSEEVSDVSQIFETASLIAVGAYDGESFIYWLDRKTA